ncbi:transporter, major facilitator family protein [Ancylostoma ceylanicum]|uniref:Transporter, major facilitator family protein n=1 Tax=Ancylostoma ceylanicum TaxID=53326 RepID=A0A0D6M0V8_9BILA|nr:transporter, major facilitator family protein [Ancylostoma ceylanicum]
MPTKNKNCGVAHSSQDEEVERIFEENFNSEMLLKIWHSFSPASAIASISYALALWSLQSARFHMMMLLGGVTMVSGWIRGSMSMVIVCMIMRYRPKRVLTFGLLLNSVGSILTPLIAITMPYWTTAILRGIMGFGNGFMIPCSVSIVRKWFPKHEENTAIATLFIGNHMGIACSMFFTSVIGRIDAFGGWTIAAKLYGLVGLSFVVLWERRAANKPRHSSYVTATELDYIRGKRLKRGMLNSGDIHTPYKKVILLSPCIIAVCSNAYTYSFIVSTVMAYLPIYNYVVMREYLLQNGIASSLPFLCQAVSTTGLYCLSLFLKQRFVSSTPIIKTFSVIATCGVSACILALIISGSVRAHTLTLIQCITLGSLSATQIACITSVGAVAPQFTFFVLSYIEMYAHLAGTVSPVIAGILSNNGALEQRNVLLGLLALLLSTGFIFLLLAHGRREIVVDRFSRHFLSRRRRTPTEMEHREEAVHRPIQSEWSIEDPTVVVYGEGEATISLRHEDLPSDSYEDLTSDDEY